MTRRLPSSLLNANAYVPVVGGSACRSIAPATPRPAGRAPATLHLRRSEVHHRIGAGQHRAAGHARAGVVPTGGVGGDRRGDVAGRWRVEQPGAHHGDQAPAGVQVAALADEGAAHRLLSLGHPDYFKAPFRYCVPASSAVTMTVDPFPPPRIGRSPPCRCRDPASCPPCPPVRPRPSSSSPPPRRPPHLPAT